MPVLFLFVGILFLTASVRGGEYPKQLLDLFKKDLTGPNNFFVWLAAIGGIAAIGFVKELKPFSNAFLTLIFIVLIIVKKDKDGKDFFSSFISQLRST
jgi:hypothetical protein